MSALQRMLYAAALRGESSHLLAAGHTAGIDLSTLDAVHEESGAGPLPRGGQAGFVEYLDPSFPSVGRSLSGTKLFAREATVAVASRFIFEGWAWR